MRVLAWPAAGHREVNPYTYLLHSSMKHYGVAVEEFSTTKLLTGRYDIWHIHWPEHFLNRRGWFQAIVKSWALPALMDVAHALGTKIVWTAHNLSAHECYHPELEERFWKRFTDRLDGFVSLSSSAFQLVTERHGSLRRLPAFIIPHGHYRDEYPITYARDAARRQLGIGSCGPVLLNFGAIRRYKGILELIRAFKNVFDPSAKLIIAGTGRDPDLLGTIRIEASHDPRVMLSLERIRSGEVQMYFAASDVVILPYTTTLNSGSAMLALSLNRPVYVPAVGSIPELQHHVGDCWMRTYSGDLGPAILDDAIAWSRLGRAHSAPLDEFGWEHLTQRTVAAYRQILTAKNLLRVAGANDITSKSRSVCSHLPQARAAEGTSEIAGQAQHNAGERLKD